MRRSTTTLYKKLRLLYGGWRITVWNAYLVGSEMVVLISTTTFCTSSVVQRYPLQSYMRTWDGSGSHQPWTTKKGSIPCTGTRGHSFGLAVHCFHYYPIIGQSSSFRTRQSCTSCDAPWWCEEKWWILSMIYLKSFRNPATYLDCKAKRVPYRCMGYRCLQVEHSLEIHHAALLYDTFVESMIVPWEQRSGYVTKQALKYLKMISC